MPLNDHVRRGEWRCLNCGSINSDDDQWCWSCDYNIDGTKGLADEDGFDHEAEES